MALHVTKNLAYWHMPKTGGMSVYRIMREVGAQYERINGPARHGRSAQIPAAALKGRLLFGTVRNPEDWYLSLFQHVSSNENGMAVLALIGNGDPSFKAVLFGLTHAKEIIAMPAQFACVFAVPDLFRSHYLDSGLGLCSWVFRYVYGRPPRPETFLDTSRLVQGMATLLCVPRQKVAAVTTQNKSEHRPKTHIENPHDLYDDEMLNWVREADAPLIETFGFTAPFGPARNALMDTAELVFAEGLR